MKVRDGHATVNGDPTEHTMPSGSVEIIADDGRTLFSITEHDGCLNIHAGMVCKHKGEILDDRLMVIPIACNRIEIRRPVYSERV